MARKLISVLGTSDYKTCNYRNENNVVETRFIQEAILKMYMPNINNKDKIIVLLTEKARNNNWIDTEKTTEVIDILANTLKFNNFDIEYIENFKNVLKEADGFDNKVITNKKEGLKTILERQIPSDQIVPVDIKEGKSEEELWDTFEKIYDVIEKDDEIIFDITHGFRSIPMLALTVLNYTKVLKNTKILGIYYGAYEAKDKTNTAPIFNLTSYNDVLEWTKATEAFTKFGNGNAIYSLFEDFNRSLIENRDYKLNRSYLKKFVSSINDFTSCIETSRGRIVDEKEIKKKSQRGIYNAALSINETLSKVKEEKDDLIKPLVPLFDEVEKKIEDFCIKSNEEVGIQTIEWCIEHRLIQQGYTAFEETIKTFVCNLYGLSEDEKGSRESIAKNALNIIKHNIANKKPERYIEEAEINDSKILEKTKEIVSTIPLEIVELSRISDKRNDINHFGYRKNAAAYDDLEKQLKKNFEKFKEIREKYKNKKLI